MSWYEYMLAGFVTVAAAPYIIFIGMCFVAEIGDMLFDRPWSKKK